MTPLVTLQFWDLETGLGWRFGCPESVVARIVDVQMREHPRPLMLRWEVK